MVFRQPTGLSKRIREILADEEFHAEDELAMQCADLIRPETAVRVELGNNHGKSGICSHDLEYAIYAGRKLYINVTARRLMGIEIVVTGGQHRYRLKEEHRKKEKFLRKSHTLPVLPACTDAGSTTPQAPEISSDISSMPTESTLSEPRSWPIWPSLPQSARRRNRKLHSTERTANAEVY